MPRPLLAAACLLAAALLGPRPVQGQAAPISALQRFSNVQVCTPFNVLISPSDAASGAPAYGYQVEADPAATAAISATVAGDTLQLETGAFTTQQPIKVGGGGPGQGLGQGLGQGPARGAPQNQPVCPLPPAPLPSSPHSLARSSSTYLPTSWRGWTILASWPACTSTKASCTRRRAGRASRQGRAGQAGRQARQPGGLLRCAAPHATAPHATALHGTVPVWDAHPSLRAPPPPHFIAVTQSLSCPLPPCPHP